MTRKTAAALSTGIAFSALAFGAPMQWSDAELFASPRTLPDTGLDQYRAPGLRSFLLEGAPDEKGNPTYAYTYYGLPDTPMPDGGYPAVVLVHGGGGTAFPFYANAYRKMGYAVITFDHYGQLPIINPSGRSAYSRAKRPILANSWQAAAGSFGERDTRLRHLWIKNVIPLICRANTFLRSQKEINPNQIGLLGISWGSVTGEIAVSFDHRFQYAVFCYGCGNWDLSSPKCNFYNYRNDTFEPKYYLNKITTPCLWVGGTNDDAFEIAPWQKSWQSAPGTVATSLVVELDHDHVGWDYAIVLRFADSFRGKDTALPKISATEVKGDVAQAKILSPGDGIIGAEFNYTADAEPGSARKWRKTPAQILPGGVVKATIPADAKAFYFNVFDREYPGEWQFGVSSTVVEK